MGIKFECYKCIYFGTEGVYYKNVFSEFLLPLFMCSILSYKFILVLYYCR